MEDWPDAYYEGFTCHMYGEPHNSNPYDESTNARQRWWSGWLDREEHQQAKAECFPGW